MAETFHLSPEDWQNVLTLSTKYPEHVLFKACFEAYASKSDISFHPLPLQQSFNSSDLGALSSSSLGYPIAPNLSQRQAIDAQSGEDYALEAIPPPPSPPQYKTHQDYEVFKQNSIASPAVSQISHLDIDSSTIEQSTLQQNTKTQKLAPKFFCTFCAENGKSEKNKYSTKSDWKKHLTKFHETGEEFPCSICAEVFRRYCDLSQHFRRSHPDQPTPSDTDIRVQLPNKDDKLAFGCGFIKCKAVLSAWEEWCKHVAGHIEHGETMSQWRYSTVIRNLLRQEGICDEAKAFLTQACNKWKRDRSQLEWRPENPITRVLRQKLESCNFGPDRDAFLEISFRMGFNMPVNLPSWLGISNLNSIPKHNDLNMYELDDIPTDSLQIPYTASQFENAPPKYQIISSSLEQPQRESTITETVQRQDPSHELPLNAMPPHILTSTSLDPAIRQEFKFNGQYQHQQQQQPNTEPRNNGKISAPQRLMNGLKRPRLLKKSQHFQPMDNPNTQAVNSPRQWPMAEPNNVPHLLSRDHNPNFLFADPPRSNGLPRSILTAENAGLYRDVTQITRSSLTQGGTLSIMDELTLPADNVLHQSNAFRGGNQVPPGARSASDRSRRRAIYTATSSRSLSGSGIAHDQS